MARIKVEHKASGAPKGVRADGVLSVTAGVLTTADNFMDRFVELNVEASRYASMLFFLNPETGNHSVLHYQPQYTVFPEHNRSYTTRILYEISPEEFKKCQCSFSSLIDQLTLMRDYDERVFNANNIVEVDPKPSKLTEEEEAFCSVLKYALLYKKQVYVQLGYDDRLFGDEVRMSPKLRSILRVFDVFPMEVRQYLSMGYIVENNSVGTRWIRPYLSVVAHCDELANWEVNEKDIVIIDWCGATLRIRSTISVSQEDVEAVDSCSPLVARFYGRVVRPFESFSSLFHLIPENIDRVIEDLKGNRYPSINDIAILKLVFQSDKLAYHHENVAEALLKVALNRPMGGPSKDEIFKAYPELRKSDVMIDYVVGQIDRSTELTELIKYDTEYDKSEKVKDAIKKKIADNLTLMDACAQQKNSKFSQKYNEIVKVAIKKVGNKDKLNRINNSYFGLTIDDLKINSWKEFSELYNSIKENDKLANNLPYDIRWQPLLDKKTYSIIEDRLTDDEQRLLHEKSIASYFTNPEYRYLLEEKLTKNELLSLWRNANDEDKRVLLNTYWDRQSALNYDDVVVHKEHKSLAECARMAYICGDVDTFDKAIMDDIQDADTIEVEYLTDYLEKVKVSFKEKLKSKSDELNAPKTFDDLISCIDSKNKDDKDKAAILNSEEKLVICYNASLKSDDPKKFLVYYEKLFGRKGKKRIEFLRKEELYNTYVSFFQGKADEFINDVFFSNATDDPDPNDILEGWNKSESINEISKCSKSSKFIIDRIVANSDFCKSFYNIFARITVDEDINVEVKQKFLARLLKKLLLKWKKLNLDVEKIKPNTPSSVHKKIGIAACLGILVFSFGFFSGIIFFKPKSPVISSQPIPSAPIVDSLFVKITIGEDTSNGVWQSYPLDSMHPNVILANTLLDTLYKKATGFSISVKCTYYHSAISMEKVDPTKVFIPKDQIHSVSLLLPIDSAYCEYLKKSKNIKNQQMDTLTYVCGKDTIKVAPGQSFLRQIISNEKYAKDTVSHVIRGTDTIRLFFKDFIERNETPRYLQTTDYYLWVIQQLHWANLDSKGVGAP